MTTYLILLVFLFIGINVSVQDLDIEGGANITAALDVESTTYGFLPPRIEVD